MKALFAMMLAFLLLGCDEDRDLQRVIESQKIKAKTSFFTENPEELAFPVKLIFAIDNSTSMGNIPGFDGGADPTNLRTQLALDYINQLDDLDNYYFQLILWSNGINRAYRRNGSVVAVTNNASDFGGGITSGTNPYVAQRNGGNTAYLEILDVLERIVRSECPSNSEINRNLAGLTNCTIIFFTDGLPTDNQFTGKSHNAVVEALTERVAAIRDLAFERGVGDFQFNTIFLVPPVITLDPVDPDQQLNNAREILQQMSAAGNGTFTVFEDARNVTYDSFDFRVAIEYELKNVIVHNYMAHSGLDENGVEAISVDSDADGLPDFREEALGTDPTKYDMDNDGKSDYYEYRQSQVGSSGFDPRVPSDFLVAACNIATTEDYKDSDGDFLTDCEETLLQTDLRNVDEDGDYFPDSIEFKLRSQVKSYTDVQDSDFDGIIDVVEMRQNTPLDLNAPRLQETFSYKPDDFTYQSIVLSDDSENASVIRNYQFVINNIDLLETKEVMDINHRLYPFYDFKAGDNLICMWIVQEPVRALNTQPVYSRACKISNYYLYNSELEFRSEDFEIIQPR